ncbi:MAG: hypothetical protein E6398_31460, partial [Pseudomonas aeruginosa]|nr:hypothetical protein [Pseudomonas aeruginosa]
DRRDTVLADSAQQRLAKVGILDHDDRMVMQARAYGFRMRPSSDHVRRTLANEVAAQIGQWGRGPSIGGGRAEADKNGNGRETLTKRRPSLVSRSRHRIHGMAGRKFGVASSPDRA